MSSSWSNNPVSTPAPPAPVPATNSKTGGITTLVIVVMLVVVGVSAIAASSGGRSFWPARWDPRVASIARRDEVIRKLRFEHPVPVRFLSEKAFVRLLGAEHSRASGEERASVDRSEATFRAFGFIGGKVDLFEASQTADEASVLAYYDSEKKEIVVRGTELDVSRRAVLAHELTHVLQDQHFDLTDVHRRASKADAQRGASAQAMTAIIEGDASHVMDEYVRRLPRAERERYEREQHEQSGVIGKASAGIPPFVSLLFGAPYDFGPLAVRVLIASGGYGAVNAALIGPTPSSGLFVQTGLVEGPRTAKAPPELAPDEQADGPPESFGPFELYLTLAMRVDPARALAAADAVQGGLARGIRKGGKHCYRAQVESPSDAAARFVAGTAREWASSATRGSVRRSGSSVTITACDPGRKAKAPTREVIVAADELLAVRGALTAGIAERDVAPDVARCVARLVVREPGMLPILEERESEVTPPQQQLVQDLVRRSAMQCREDSTAGLR